MTNAESLIVAEYAAHSRCCEACMAQRRRLADRAKNGVVRLPRNPVIACRVAGVLQARLDGHTKGNSVLDDLLDAMVRATESGQSEWLAEVRNGAAKTGLSKTCPRCGRIGEAFTVQVGEALNWDIIWGFRERGRGRLPRQSDVCRDLSLEELTDPNYGCGFD